MLGKVSSKNNIFITILGKNVDSSGNKVKVKRRSTTALQASKSNMTGQATHQTDQTDYHRSDRYYNRSDRLNRIIPIDLHTLHNTQVCNPGIYPHKGVWMRLAGTEVDMWDVHGVKKFIRKYQ